MPTPSASPPRPGDFRRHLTVETPEQVEVRYEIAGIGSRILAAIADQLIIVAWGLGLLIFFGLFSMGTGVGGGISRLIWFIVWGVGTFAYFIFFEAFRQGQTPGKRANGIRVVQTTGHPITFGAAVARNLLRAADFLPAGYVVGSAMVMLHPSARRLGDLVAGTIVVRDRPFEAAKPVEAPARTERAVAPPIAASPLLTDEEFRLLTAFRERRAALTPEVATRLADSLVARFAARFPTRDPDPARFLLELHLAEQDRRAGARSGTPGAVASRFAATGATRWDQFEAIADRGARRGLDTFSAAELPDFAARYRETAADLARARTYGANPTTISRLERIVAAGHNLLYRDRRRALSEIGGFLLRTAPAAVARAWPVVLLAAGCLIGAAGAGWMLIRERPALAQEVLPDIMLDRAAAGHARRAQGEGYYEAPAGEQPLMAAQIIGNNTHVAFLAFAGGVFLGVGSLLLLAFNGLELGVTAAHFANQGLLGYLLTFIVGHGALELFAITVAGASGFILGFALVAPGDHSRTDALAVAARRALPMVAAAAVMLGVAGTIEGLVSASDAGVTERIGLSAASLLFLFLYLLNGWLHRGDAPTA